ncbi:MAG: addiction module toxin, HicA family [Methanospirillum sp.]|nr:addiction module toxin, HicA family [Methanospirillum sp.]
MPRLPAVSGAVAARAFTRAGFGAVRQTGSHLILMKPGIDVTLSVPLHAEVKRGTLRRLIADAGLTVDEFCALL